MPTLASLITQARQNVRDFGIGSPQYAFQAKLKGANDGTNKVFQTEQRNIVALDALGASAVFFDIGTSIRQNSGFTVTDPTNGVITFGTAPAANSNPFQAYFYWQWATDAEYTAWLNDAAAFLEYTDPTLVPSALSTAMMKFVESRFYTARASSFADKFNSSGGIAGQDANPVSEQFRKLSKDAMALAMQLRTEYYQNPKRFKPASGVTAYGTDPGSPIR